MKNLKLYKGYFVGLGLLVVLIGVILGAHAIATHTDYPDTRNPTQTITKLNEASENYVIIFHRTGCKDCESVQKQVRKFINNNPTKTYVVIDLAKKENEHFIADYGLVQTPSFIKVHQSQIIDAYHGTNINKIKEMMS